MEPSSKEAYWAFILLARRRALPYECILHVFQWLIGANAFIRDVFKSIELFTQVRYTPGMYHHIGRNAMLLEVDIVEHCAPYLHYRGTVAPLSVFQLYGTPRYHKIAGVIIAEAIFVDTLPQAVVQAMHNVLHQATMLTRESFATFFPDPAVLPYAAFVAGATWYTNHFITSVPDALVERYKLHHFVLLGVLSQNSHSMPYMFETDEALLLDMLRIVVSLKDYELLAHFEQRLNFERASAAFVEQLVLAMVHMENYKRSLTPLILAKEEILISVLHALLSQKVRLTFIMKFECMVNLNVRSRAFRETFISTVMATEGYAGFYL